MNISEGEEGQMNLVSESSASPKRSVKPCHITFGQKDTGEVTEPSDTNDSSNQDFHSIVKNNSIIVNNKAVNSKFINHSVDDRDTNENEENFKGSLDIENIKKEDSAQLDEKETIKPSKIILTNEQLNSLSKEELVEKWLQQEHYISSLQTTLDSAVEEVTELKRSHLNEERLKNQVTELQRKEQYHIMRLATKEHEIQELGAQIEELKNLTASGNSLKNSLLDPAINLLFERMKRDFDTTKSKMEEAQNELAAWKFTPDSNTGKQLMAKCRLLIKENEELGKMISSGRLAKLEGDLALQRSLGDELKKSQSELEEFLQEMDEDTEGMQGTILYLQSQLRQAKEKISHLTNQLSLGQTTSNNNTPASVGETGDFAEGSLSEPEPLHNEDSLQPFSDEGRTLIPDSSEKFLFKSNDRNDDESTLSTKPNGDLLGNVNNNNSNSRSSLITGSGECSRASDGSNTHLKSFPNGRKRTQSVLEGDDDDDADGEGVEGDGAGAESQTHHHPLRTTLQAPSNNGCKKRTRIEVGEDAEEGSTALSSDHVMENGLTIK